MPQHHAIIHVVRIHHPLKRAEILFPLLEELFNGESLVCTPVVRAVFRRLAALWALLLYEICDGAFGLRRVSDMTLQSENVRKKE
jgi:hypothetical protein